MSDRTNAVGLVNVTTVHPSQLIANPNGMFNYRNIGDHNDGGKKADML